MKVPTFWIKCRADVQMINDLPSVIHKDLESHGVANMLGNTNPTATFLMEVQRKIGVIKFVVDGLIPMEVQQRADVICQSSKSLNGNGTSTRSPSSNVRSKSWVQPSWLMMFVHITSLAMPHMAKTVLSSPIGSAILTVPVNRYPKPPCESDIYWAYVHPCGGNRSML